MGPIAVVVVALVLASCQILDSLTGRVFEPLELSISNQTELAITLVVNGQAIGEFAPGAHEDPIDAVMLPLPPWQVEARTPSGRVLLTLAVQPANVWRSTPDAQGHSSSMSAGNRADLSCGRLDIWSGAPMLGPAPPSSFPAGDCDP